MVSGTRISLDVLVTDFKRGKTPEAIHEAHETVSLVRLGISARALHGVWFSTCCPPTVAARHSPRSLLDVVARASSGRM